jgi:hypothetical protein
MTRARSEIIIPNQVGTFHVISRCVRRQLLLEKGHRKTWLCNGLAGWLGHMGIDLLAYAIMGNHVHLVLRVRPDIVKTWNNHDLARHALAVLPVRSGPGLEPLTVTPAVVERYAGNAKWLAQQRTRLSSPSWLLRLIKQGVSRRANTQDGCTGHFWEKRFTSVSLLDAAAVLACMVYVDLNPFRAAMVKDPLKAIYTSIRHRVVRADGAGRSDHNADDHALGGRLAAMPQCAPANSWSGEFPGWGISEQDYVNLVRETALSANRNARGAVENAFALVNQMGIEPTDWLSSMSEGGSMSGTVIGGPEARRRWCDQTGQRWAADKSGLWQ